MSRPVKDQVQSSTVEYVAQVLRAGGYSSMERRKLKPLLESAVMSGIALAASWLVSNDGSDTATPQALLKGVEEAGAAMGLGYRKLKDG